MKEVRVGKLVSPCWKRAKKRARCWRYFVLPSEGFRGWVYLRLTTDGSMLVPMFKGDLKFLQDIYNDIGQGFDPNDLKSAKKSVDDFLVRMGKLLVFA